MASILSGTLIGLLILVATLFYQGAINYWGFLLGIGIIFAFFIALSRNMQQMNIEHLNDVNELIQKIENGEPLPSINQLTKVKK